MKQGIKFNIEDIAEITTEAIYVVDYEKHEFCFVADHDFFLCGYHAKEVKKMGYHYYKRIMCEDDQKLMKDIRTSIFKRISDITEVEKINYFSFYVRIKNETGYVMAYYKFKPLFVAGKIKYGLCMLTPSVVKNTGCLRLYYRNSLNYEEYTPNERKWENGKLEHLTMQEKKILKLAVEGKKGLSIADLAKLTHETLRYTLSKLYRKLNVQTMTEAIMFTINHRLLYMPENNNKIEEKKRKRRMITDEKMKRIQEGLDKGKSVNSTAMQENIAESAIRYWIEKGKLKK